MVRTHAACCQVLSLADGARVSYEAEAEADSKGPRAVNVRTLA